MKFNRCGGSDNEDKSGGLVIEIFQLSVWTQCFWKVYYILRKVLENA